MMINPNLFENCTAQMGGVFIIVLDFRTYVSAKTLFLLTAPNYRAGQIVPMGIHIWHREQFLQIRAARYLLSFAVHRLAIHP